MKTLLTTVLTFLCLHLSAQTLATTKDPFTGIETKGALVLLGRSTVSYGMMLGLTIQNNKKYISFMWRNDSGTFGAFNGISANNLGLMFKMEGDTIYKFKPDSLHSKITNSGNSTLMAFACEITDTQLNYLTSHKISIFRVVVSSDGNGVDLNSTGIFTDKNKVQIEKSAAYILGIQWFDD